MLQTFKRYIDTTILIPEVMTLEEAQSFYSYEQSEKPFYEHLYQLIKNEIETEEKENSIRKSKFYELKEDLINRHVLQGDNLTEYFNVFAVIRSVCNSPEKNFISINEEEKWKRAIEISKRFNQVIGTYNESIEKLKSSWCEEFDRANSLKIMRDHGCAITINDENIEISCDKVFNDIDREIKRIGGFTIINFLLKILDDSDKYSALFDRFLIHQETNMLTQSKPQIPFGYLLNICAKYPHSDIPVSNIEIKRVISLAIIACNATYAVQHYSVWHYFNCSGENTIRMLLDVVLWDSIFSIPQVKLNYQIQFMEYLISKLDSNLFRQTVGFSLDDFLMVVNAIFNYSLKNRPTRFAPQELAEQLKIPIYKLIIILNFLCHKKSPNAEYILPNDTLKIDFYLKPLIRHKDQYILVWRSWNVAALFESIATVLRKKVVNFDSSVGVLQEDFIKLNLSNKGISYCCGKYKVGKVNGEADLVIETTTKIVLIEMKKKGLSRKTKSGSDVGLIIDLSETTIHAMTQSAKIELLLRKHESLELMDGNGKKKVLELRGRTFEHLSLTYHELGTLHDKEIMRHLYLSLLRYEYGVIDKSDTESIRKFDNLKKKQKEFVAQYNELMAQEAMPKNNPYFNNWFISFNQLMEVISLSSDNESFYENLTMHKFSSTGSFDYYFEFQYAKQLLKQQPKLLEVMKDSNVVYIPLRGGE